MINNGTIRNCTRSFPAIQGMVNEHALGKIIIKNVYQGWRGESIKQIKDKHEQNPYSLRIGMPSTDEQLKNDAIYFILHYLSYNPLTKDIEKREIVPYRNMEKLYVGQSLEEKSYIDYKVFIDGNIVADELYLKKYTELKDTPIGELLLELINKTDKLQLEVINLKRQLNKDTIYSNINTDE